MKKIDLENMDNRYDLYAYCLERFEARADAQGYRDEPEMEEPEEDASEEEWDRYMGHKPKKERSELQMEFLLGVTCALDYLLDADATDKSSIPPVLFFKSLRGEYITKEDFDRKPKKEEEK